jgi:hypothetical protein
MGRTKMWQVVPDMYGKEQVDKVQAAIQAPLQEQLDEWDTENDNKTMTVPVTNETIHKLRDHPDYVDNLDHDYDNIIYERQKKQVYEQLRNTRFETLLDKYQQNNTH